MALYLFISIDKHRHIRLLAQILMFNKTTSSYMWVFNNFLKVTNNIALLTIFSDCDTGLEPVIKTVFPTTRYLHCIFYIVQNIKKHLMHPLCTQITKFQSDFFICHNTLFKKIFEFCFELLYTKFPESSQYLKNTLYPIKYRWAKYFTLVFWVKLVSPI
jgi:hypothetical protein